MVKVTLSFKISKKAEIFTKAKKAYLHSLYRFSIIKCHMRRKNESIWRREQRNQNGYDRCSSKYREIRSRSSG